MNKVERLESQIEFLKKCLEKSRQFLVEKNEEVERLKDELEQEQKEKQEIFDEWVLEKIENKLKGLNYSDSEIKKELMRYKNKTINEVKKWLFQTRKV